jgi:acetolactate synthase-1/2/3 large subunit
MSGIGECYLDGIPLLVITGGPRTDVPFGYQLHEIDQQRLVDGIVKRSWKVKDHSEIVPVIFEAYQTAVSGMPGPVLVELPVNLQLFSQRVEDVPAFVPFAPEPVSLDRELDAAVRMLCDAAAPGQDRGDSGRPGLNYAARPFRISRQSPAPHRHGLQPGGGPRRRKCLR